LTWIVYGLVILGLDEWDFYYMMPLDLFISMLLGATLNHGWRYYRVNGRLTFLRQMGVVALVLGVSMASTLRRRFTMPSRPVSTDFTAIGKALQGIARPDESLAVGAAGAIPYLSNLTTIDTLGLNDRHIARVSPDPLLSFGHQRGDGSYVWARLPTYLIPFPVLTARPYPGPGKDKSFREMFAQPGFQQSYVFTSVRMPDGRYWSYYRRRTDPGGGQSD
jgi:hypothetical protein